MIQSYGIGISTINAGQRALELVGQNIANATTPGYHRQGLNFSSTTINGTQGTGVEVQRIFRYEVPTLRNNMVNATSDVAQSTTQLDSQRQLEALFSTGNGSIGGQLDNFFNQLEKLSTQPSNSAQKRVSVDAATTVSNQFNQMASDLGDMKQQQFKSTLQAVDTINTLVPKIADLNHRIAEFYSKGDSANDLRDQRDSAITELSQYMDIRVSSQENGIVNVQGQTIGIVVGDFSTKFNALLNANGTLSIQEQGTNKTITPNSGKLAGYLQEYNTTIPSYATRLDDLAKQFIQSVNQVQATGLSTNGPVTTLSGTASVADPLALLNTQTLPSAIQSGTLSLSITNQATGTRSLVGISIDPATQSLTDVANAISTASGGLVQGSIDPGTNSLRIQANSGYSFDFAGRVPTPPNGIAMNGTSVPSVSGTYSGTGNDTYTFNVIGSGTVGTTPGLNLEVRNSANSLITTLNVGDGYRAGDPINVGNGLIVRLGAGTTNAGTFNVPVTANPDTSGVLAGLGVGGVFKGSGASSIAVNQQLKDNPNLLATSRNGDPSETSNLLRMSNLRDQQLLSGGTQTFAQHYGDTVGTLGISIASTSDLQTTQTNLLNNLTAQEQSTVGVDLNEEMVNLLNYQRMIESGSRYLSVVNKALDTLFTMFS